MAKISGMATKIGTFNFSVSAVDELGRKDSKTLTMTAREFKSKWLEDARFGFMSQWGPFSAPSITCKEDIHKFEERIVNFDAEQWAQQVEDMGGRFSTSPLWAVTEFVCGRQQLRQFMK